MHMGGVFGDKAATLDRFRENYAKLSPSIKARLVLENDDVSWSVHDLLPVCEELNIPLVLDYHHHNILFDKSQIREGTKDIMELYPRISKTWTRKNIKQKMHYSEPTPAAITPMQRRKHSPRVATLPPCAQDMDLMIEAKDKEQAVFELMRNFKLPGFDSFNDMIPHVRNDDNKAYAQQQSRPKKATPKKPKSKKKVKDEEDALSAAEEALEAEAEAAAELKPVPEEEVGMGGPEGRVYWPPGMEDWLRPKKREVTKKEKAPEPDGPKVMTPAIKRTAAAADLAESKGMKLTPAQKRARRAVAEIEAAGNSAAEAGEAGVKVEGADGNVNGAATPVKKKTKAAPAKEKRKREVKAAPTPSTSDDEDDASSSSGLSDEENVAPVKPAAKATAGARKAAGRAK
ncbi:hypothetical protein H2199_000065 [Coniosporium tulheliwenetii]|uniref:Uncharacterized protein n=1 Tax=Coniosporium tulheliwenetii TaxID=3383036 RepID=A0ACC2ZNZ7_9PEZI|nr:hypothetical protein H2199_000065 [Cladosporium sp. JES 115]